jgi:FkbM family methyltransferase
MSNKEFSPIYNSITSSSLKEVEEILEKTLSSKIEHSPIKLNKPIIIYGAGNLGKMAKDFFNYLKIPFLYVVDRNANNYKNDEFWKDTKIIHPDDVNEEDKKNSILALCIVTLPYTKLQTELKKQGWNKILPFYDTTNLYSEKYPINNGWNLNNFNIEEIKTIKKIYSLLEDDISKIHYTQFLLWRRSRIELLFKNLEINNNIRFFIPEVTNLLQQNEVFIDCGTHHGSVIEKFLKITNNKYKTIYAIEPDELNYKILETKLKDYSNITMIKCALSKKKGQEKFYHGFDFASKLNKNGNEIVNTITLDSLNIPVTFLKMHLEGGELNALKGSIDTIQKSRPIITVTAYHNSDGIWKIPDFLKNNTKNYKYYFRLHSWCGTGAVFYAIPKEREGIKSDK